MSMPKIFKMREAGNEGKGGEKEGRTFYFMMNGAKVFLPLFLYRIAVER